MHWKSREGPKAVSKKQRIDSDWKDRSAPCQALLSDQSAPSQVLSASCNATLNWQDRSRPTEEVLSASGNGPKTQEEPPEPPAPPASVSEVDLHLGPIRLSGGQALTSGGKLKPSPTSPLSKDAQNGMSRARIETLLRDGCCSCRNRCWTKFKAAMLVSLCAEFWALPHAEQNFLIHTMYNMNSQQSGTVDQPFLPEWKDRTTDKCDAVVNKDESPLWSDDEFPKEVARRTQWKLMNTEVCMEAFYRLLGMGKHRLLNCMAGALDMRQSPHKIPGSKERSQFHICWRFLAELYVSSGEASPTEFRSAKDVIDAKEGQPEPLLGDLISDGLDVSDLCSALTDWLPKLLSSTNDVHYTSRNQGLPEGMPIRYIQYSRIHDLYWLFVATVTLWFAGSSRRVPSWSVFYRAWYHPWRMFLRFRKSSSHSQCNFCWQCHQLLRKHLPLADKYDVAMRLKAHLQGQYSDRAIYWALREASKLKVDSILCIIIDSMDKSKFAIPRWPWGRNPKLLEGFVRPVITVTAVMAHGFATMFFLADETIEHGSNAFLEVLLLAMEKVLKICKAKHIKFPEHLVVQSDNPTNQAKNSVACIFLAYLVASSVFLTTTLNFLIVGHTHEDKDALFGFLCGLLIRAQVFDSPGAVIDLLEQGMIANIAAKGEELVCAKLDFVRNFEDWLAPLGLKLHGSFANRNKLSTTDMTTVHSIYFKSRCFLFPAEKKQLLLGESRDFSSNNRDVFACFKVYMHSTSLSQPPLLIIPVMWRNRLVGKEGGPQSLTDRVVVDAKRQYDLLKRAKLLSNPVNHMFDIYFPYAAIYYRQLVEGGPAPDATVLAPSRLLTEHSCDFSEPSKSSSSQEFPHLPDTAWKMQITHHK